MRKMTGGGRVALPAQCDIYHASSTSLDVVASLADSPPQCHRRPRRVKATTHSEERRVPGADRVPNNKDVGQTCRNVGRARPTAASGRLDAARGAATPTLRPRRQATKAPRHAVPAVAQHTRVSTAVSKGGKTCRSHRCMGLKGGLRLVNLAVGLHPRRTVSLKGRRERTYASGAVPTQQLSEAGHCVCPPGQVSTWPSPRMARAAKMAMVMAQGTSVVITSREKEGRGEGGMASVDVRSGRWSWNVARHSVKPVCASFVHHLSELWPCMELDRGGIESNRIA